MTLDRPEPRTRQRGVLLVVLAGLWIVVALAAGVAFGSEALLWLLAITVPPGGLALGAQMSDLTEELARIRAETALARKIPVAAPPAASLESRLAELAATTARTEAKLATFTSTRAPAGPEADATPAARGDRTAHAASAPKAGSRKAAAGAGPKLTLTSVQPTYDEQHQLALGPEVEAPKDMPLPDLIRALNFPEDDRDTAGFDALRRALKDPLAGRLVKASQDVLTLLSQDGIYMDDLPPDRARPEVWRRFAKGERGRAMAALGGVRDRSSLALTAGRMREDVIFRDAAHHFLRLFDRTLMAVEPRATDAELVDLADTRTARAFMLLGRVNGAFD
ncbi:hypothetical protein [Salipiger sp. IMCC34102]|uniref:hypothetical protein n=1 Tax=Salipiger sp. IMCC34102 TaxID=2510647 RepID=UPI001F5E01B6|nr:hypothetical protein [Salipiger sp. IMCC34102]